MKKMFLLMGLITLLIFLVCSWRFSVDVPVLLEFYAPIA